MSSAATLVIDSAKDLHKRVSDFGNNTPNYQLLLAGYSRLNLPPGSAVLLLASNSFEFLLHFIAVLANGLVPVAVSPSTKSTLINALVKSLQISAIAGPRIEPTRHAGQAHTLIGTYNVSILDRGPPPYEPFDVLVLTTGSSGSQTACVHRIDSLVCNAGMTNRTLGIVACDKQLVMLPLYHSYGLITQSIGSIISGCELKIDVPPFNAGRFADLILKERISVCGITPTIARELLRKGTTLPPVRSMSIGGDRLTREEVAELLAKPFINELYITYGLTEAGPRVSVLPSHLSSIEHLDSVGRPFAEVTALIETPDPTGIGQLLVKTPSVLRRKVGAPGIKQPLRADGFLETGDLFTKDASGYLRYVGRTTDMLVTKGEKLNTRSVSEIAELHPDVSFARTTGEAGDILVTAVWPRDGKMIDLDELKAFMKLHLRHHEIPDKIIQHSPNIFHK
jgi:long-chain acyl-CoA synthetase